MGTLRLLLLLTATVLAVVLPGLAPALAQGRQLQLIRDAEVETIIRIYATPLFQAAGLDPKAIEVYLVKDPTLNAFVAGGQNLFINTGLLIKAEDPLEVIGVIAHETGHIAGGHVVARGSAIDDASNTALASYVLGILGAIASGRGEVASAVIFGGQDLALRNLLSFTRSQEQSADQAAITYLNASQISPSGLLSFMERMQGQEVLLAVNQDPYLTTHPLTRERITFLEREVAASPYANQPASQELQALHARMRAKLIGFLESRQKVDRVYPPSDQSMPARYARSILEYREGNLDKALALVDNLLAEYPDDPYFLELKAQMLFEHGRMQEALPIYEAAVAVLPDAPQIRLMLARTQIELNTPEQDRQAVDNLKRVLRDEPQNGFAWRLAAVAYGRQGDEAMAALAMGEYAFARGEFDQAQYYAQRARDMLASGSPAWLQADDLAIEAERRRKAQR